VKRLDLDVEEAAPSNATTIGLEDHRAAPGGACSWWRYGLLGCIAHIGG
jgi:hypothetical protein